MSTVAERPAEQVAQVGLVRAYISLTKPRIVELLLVTTVPAMLLAKRGVPSLWLILATVVGGTLAAGSANVLNCWYDRDIDPLMRRTSKRPLVTGRITPRGALTFGLTLGTVAVALMAVTTNWLATALTFAAIIYYAVIYTMWLKRTTPHNTVLGGACGAAPVLIGWAAVTGSLSASAWLLFAVMFFWQPPHFWALAMKFKDDYAAASIPMLPVVASARRVALESVIYTVLTVVASLALWPAAHLSWVYGVPALVAGAIFTNEAVRFYLQARRGGELKTMRLFHWSLTYVTVLFVAVAVDALLTG
ncbi:heme o synthase [Longispora sp. K20-0274]|uniref:heme o synthase n=1 Tax=Longispora sp. K20-0274 TaxID=3088255 RepID=UPI003999BC5C